MQNDKEKFKKEFIQRLIKFSLENIRYCSEFRKDPNNWAICDQLIRSSTSIGANVVEAKSSSSKRDYIKFFEIALKSANETIYWLLLVKSLSDAAEVDSLLKEAKEIAKILASSVLTLKGKRD
ncbi:MAG: hypothetical protein UT66_C0010G0024 [candidate division CPR2 bacterium GW2011_GWC1_39_9]|uniref:Four helix bundle protein n=1 Tax=candidate division CPR2 bacterium GW2011_GWC2_39_10 TaxID=1618345 RepID=A0A0G0LZS5_UNCC2|nr:MAG: hypothetical protein UT18_C0018G0006 [candidate division CPR2 bacterium GW2011_GWC2_39_10]KKR35569.1 MAG: hypothetical protein UT66_C0010G0024 [candidate division CPR2 bacterium GW2011_GWC1_39_9]